jgi:hypothetical protein|tara:strand:+ start:18825 stop:19115 length:291 start_codon:yes stop_codon:yes gene_type:complete
MIEIINNRVTYIDDNANMVEVDDEALHTLADNMKLVIDDVIFDENLIKPVEPIYSYIIEKMYTMPDYAKWNDIPFKEKPKEKLLIAFNKFIHDKLN